MSKDRFELVSPFQPTGDQPEAIDALVKSIETGNRMQTLKGVTGSGKTFTMANIIQRLNRPTLVLAHNKTLAAQLCSEFKEFFPKNAVEYFVSYYDYYQPEAYIASTDTYIEKDSAINDEIEKLRHSATSSLSERRDVIIVSSISCIYTLGDPIDYRNMVISLRQGMTKDRDELIRKLVEIQYERNDINFVRNKFRVRGDVVEIYPAYSSESAIRVEFFGDEIDRLCEINTVTGEVKNMVSHVAIYPASHYIVPRERLMAGIEEIRRECDELVEYFRKNNKLIEAQRIAERTNYDIEMLQEIGFCKGIENYSRVLSGRAPGSMPYTLLDYFPEDFVIFIDESHVTLPQARGMYGGDRSRKESLIEYGFRLPSALDNRPLKFDEFMGKLKQIVCVSATPGELEKSQSSLIAEQVIRPTGLLDPEIDVRPVEGQTACGGLTAVCTPPVPAAPERPAGRRHHPRQLSNSFSPHHPHERRPRHAAICAPLLPPHRCGGALLRPRAFGVQRGAAPRHLSDGRHRSPHRPHAGHCHRAGLYRRHGAGAPRL